jgi:DNA-directed RNA polymerase specialized sigma24 family protein
MDKREARRFLRRELCEFEAKKDISAEERVLLREWVEQGNSVYENPNWTAYEDGSPMDFIDAHRFDEAVFAEINSLPPEEREAFIVRLYAPCPPEEQALIF